MRLNVDITEEQYKALKEIAKDSNITVSDILSNYIADLTGIDSNGSDERLFARNYFERTGISWMFQKED